MGRWGWRRIATLCVSVWITAACSQTAPAIPPNLTNAPQATLVLRTAARTITPPPAASTVAAPQQHQEPTRTPRPSATPHYYVVQSGDTLESLASRFGISVEALQAANGGLPPDMLLPGNVLLIPPLMSASSASMTETLARLLPSDTPLPVLVSAPACYHTPADEVICLGWVQNTLSETLTNLAVQVNLRRSPDSANDQRATALAQQVIPPAGGAPYAVRFPSPVDYAFAEAALVSGETGDAATLTAWPLTVVESQQEVAGALVRVRGTIRHDDGDRELAELLMVATLFDAQDRVVGYRAQRQERTITPGEAFEAEVLVTPLAGGAVRHWLYAEGRPARAEP